MYQLLDVTAARYHVPHVTTARYHVPHVTTARYHVPHVTTARHHVPHVPAARHHLPHVTAARHHVPHVPAARHHVPHVPAEPYLQSQVSNQLYSILQAGVHGSGDTLWHRRTFARGKICNFVLPRVKGTFLQKAPVQKKLCQARPFGR